MTKCTTFTLLVFAILLASVAPLAAQIQEATAVPITTPQEERDLYKDRETLWAIGLHGGLLSGMGLGLRMNYSQRFGFQLVGGAMTWKDKFVYSVGFEGQFDFDTAKRSRLYALAAVGFYDNGEEEPKPGDEDKRLKGPLRAGLGVGYEWAVSDKMVLMANGAFTYFSNGSFLPLPQLGIFYYFR